MDGNLGGSGSMNALAALGAALDVSPDAFRLFQRELYAAQPLESAEDAFASDARLLRIAGSVPALAGNEEFQRDVTSGTFTRWAEAMCQSFLDGLDVSGTPTLRFDGEIIDTPQNAAEFRRVIDELAQARNGVAPDAPLARRHGRPGTPGDDPPG